VSAVLIISQLAFSDLSALKAEIEMLKQGR
jgi:hypothetical protein